MLYFIGLHLVGKKTIELSEKDWEKVIRMCQVFSTSDEIAHVMGVSRKTMVRLVRDKYDMYLKDFISQHASVTKQALRRKQIEKALNGDTTMLIWLGKQTLDQRDQKHVDGNITVSSLAEWLHGDEEDLDEIDVTPGGNKIEGQAE